MLLCADILLDDFLVAENSQFQSDINSPIITSERASPISSPKFNQPNINPYVTTPTLDGGLDIPSSGSMRYCSIALFSLSLSHGIFYVHSYDNLVVYVHP